MPPRRKKAVRAALSAPRTRRSARQIARTKTANSNNGIPGIYQDMLAEATENDAEDLSPDPRPIKRRKVSLASMSDVDDLFQSPPPPATEQEEIRLPSQPPVRQQQVIYDDFENSDESDVEFEDVELEPAVQITSEDEQPQPKSLQIDLSKSVLETPKHTVQRRKPVSKEERAMRLDVHKWHLLSLIGHGLQRNSWCNDEEIHAVLKALVPRKIIKLLHVDESKPQYERNHAFNKGIEDICTEWQLQWKTTVNGLRRAYWREDVDARSQADEGEDLDFEDFKDAAQRCRGSRDLGAQMFTALLRSIAVEARLVFSLQVLPFTGAAKGETPSKPKNKPEYIQASAQNYSVAASGSSPFTPPSVRPKKPKKIVDSPYPIFWTEVLTPNNTWTPLDPIVRNSISKPKTQFEPPLSDTLNSMTYVIAFEDGNSAHDVTRRYTQWFNAKTRKSRVESTKNGEQWYSSAMSVLRKKLREPRDELEEDELTRRANSEGMPNNIQDFKNHPIYVLERHMRMNEVLQPKREVGKVNVGTAKNGKIESVYRRQDVHLCRTADAWYRRGRDVRMGEQPLKHVLPKSRRPGQGPDAGLSDDEGDEEADGVGLYAEYQTDVYEPPPVINGQIPKNAYGNLDVYVASMIPPGAVHVSHTLAAAAAKQIGVDFADAVTGFDFKGRQGTAIVNGIVVAQQFTAAVAAAISGLEAMGSEEVQQARSRIILAMWKKMLQALRVRDRIEAEYGSTDTSKRRGKQKISDGEADSNDESDSEYEEEAGSDVGGGFMPEDEATEEKIQEQAVNLQVFKSKMPTILPDEVVSVPITITISPHKAPVQDQDNDHDTTAVDDGNDGLFEDDDRDVDMAGGFEPQDDNEIEVGGGFIPDDSEDIGGGGFLPASPPPQAPDKKTPKSKSSHDISRSQSTTKHGKRRTSPPGPDEVSDLLNEAVHSDAEEDSALQLAIAESLAAHTLTEKDDGGAGPSGTQRDTKGSDDNKSQKDEEAKVVGSEEQSPSSLLSHDPAEDEEEPDWVYDALEE